MASLLKFNPQALQDMREQARLSLFFFERAVWHDPDLTSDLHHRM